MKKLTALVIAAVLIAAVSISGTIAYATEANVETEVYTSGKVDIAFDNTKLDDGFKLLPGATVEKEVKIRNMADSSEAWVWFTVTVPALRSGNSLVTPVGMGEAWELYCTEQVEDCVVYTYRYTTTLAADDATTAGMTGLCFAGQLDRVDGQICWVENGNVLELEKEPQQFSIRFEAYAVQCSTEHDTFEKAYAAITGPTDET